MIKLVASFLMICLLEVSSVIAQNDTLVIRNTNVIPMDRDTVLNNHDVFISKGRIIDVTPYGQRKLENRYKIVEGKDKYLLPGFSEMHFHNQNDIRNEFKLLVANGITSARNMAEYNKQDQIAIRKLSQELSITPNYYTTGPYLMRNDLKTKEVITKVVKNHKTRGYDYLKLADNLPKNLYVHLLNEADKHELPVIGHGQRELPLEYTLRMKSIAHVEEFLNIFSKEELTNKKALTQKAKQIKTSGVYVSPTLGIYNMILNYADDNRHQKISNQPENKYLPKHYLDYWKSDSVNYRKYDWFTAKESLKRLQKELDWQMEFTKILHQEQVYLLCSSDTYGLFLPGFSLHKELALIHASGLSTFETLKTATVNPARYFGKMSQEGTISVGKRANMVLLNKNPLEKIENTKSIEAVFIKGEYLDKNRLIKLLKEVELTVSKE